VKRVNLAFVNYSAGTGGIETLILEIGRRLEKEKYNPFLFIFESGGALEKEFEDAGVKIVHVQKASQGLDFRLPFKLKNVFKKYGINVVHTHNPFSWLYGGIGAKITGIPVVHTEHTNIDYYKYHVRRWMAVEWILSQFTSHITTVAQSVADYMISNEHIDKKKIEVVYNGVDHKRFEDDIDVTLKRRGIGIDADDIVIGNVSRFFENKDHKTLIEAFKIITNDYADSKLVLVGDGPLRRNIENKVEKEGLSKKVRFLGNRRDVPELLKAMNIFALSSLREGFPVVLLEAMASGLPTVVTDVDGNAEMVVNGETGLIVPRSEPESLAKAICEIIQDKDKGREMGENGRHRVKKLFSFDGMVNRYTSIYERVSK
jgi:L-malate glycosyltransferase